MPLNLEKLKSSNRLITMLVFSAVLVLLFIPDIIGISSPLLETERFSLDLRDVGVSGDDSESEVDDDEEEAAPGEETLEQKLARKEDLEGIVNLVEAGYIDQLVARKEQGIVSESEMRASLRPEIIVQREAQERKERREWISANEINWAQIKGRASRRFLQKTQSDLQNLYRKIDSEYSGSRYSILALSSGIDKVMGDMDRTLSAPEAVEYLQHLDIEVTEAMQKENLPRSEFMEWRKISLSPVIGSRKADRIKQGIVNRFNPQLQLFNLELSSVADAGGGYSPRAQHFAHFSVQVKGKEIESITYYRDGLKLGGIGIRPKHGTRDTFVSDQNRIDAHGIYTFEVRDRYGAIYRKSYNFRRAIGQFPWKYAGNFNIYFMQLPFQPDGSGDRFFTFRVASERQNGFFTNPGENLISTF